MMSPGGEDGERRGLVGRVAVAACLACWLGGVQGLVAPPGGLTARHRADVSLTAPSMAVRSLRRQRKALESTEYDYIIVGGGTAGCVLANRLSSNPANKVLVVEAGTRSPKHPLVRIPVAILKLFKSAWDWDFATEPSPALAERSLYLCRGKGLGGSSLTNVMLYTRGSSADYDAWAAECGDDSWAGPSMLRYFKRAENCLSTENAGVGDWHGSDGPAAVSDVPYVNPLSTAFLDAAHEAGLPKNNDFNDWSKPQVGAGRYQVSQRGGERESAASAYLAKDVLKRDNLDIVVGAIVSKVEFAEGQDGGAEKKAVAVELVPSSSSSSDETSYSAKLSAASGASEVVLTAGAIGSPHVLMLSGVGAAGELERHGIDCLVDRPGVGKNLQDHPACLVSHYSVKGAPKSHSSLLRVPGTTATNPVAALRWLLRGDGPLTSPGCDHGAFLKLSPDADDDDDDKADTQLRFLATKSITPDGMSTIATSYKAARNHPNGFTIQTVLARPKSRDGAVGLASADPRDKPTITSSYFSDERDLDTMVAALKRAREIMAMPALNQYADAEEFPGADVASDEQLRNYARETVHTANALVGTCKLGRPGDAGAVVDNKLKVIGTTNLRVCDSSIMPVLPGGQTASSTIAVAEKAADMIAEDKQHSTALALPAKADTKADDKVLA